MPRSSGLKTLFQVPTFIFLRMESSFSDGSSCTEVNEKFRKLTSKMQAPPNQSKCPAPVQDMHTNIQAAQALAGSLKRS